MHRSLVIMGLMLVCLPALAGEKTAVVYDRNYPTSKRKAPCEMRIKSALREMGYQVQTGSPAGKIYLKVGVRGSCRRGMWRHKCSASAEASTMGGRHFRIESGDITGDSMPWARDEACRELAKKLRARLGGKQGKPGGGTVTYKPGKSSRVVSVSWKGDMRPMPLLKLTGFFKDMGYFAKVLESSSSHVKFRVTFEEPVEQFRSKLQTLLEAHYRIVSTCGKSKLNFQIEAQ